MKKWWKVLKVILLWRPSDRNCLRNCQRHSQKATLGKIILHLVSTMTCQRAKNFSKFLFPYFASFVSFQLWNLTVYSELTFCISLLIIVYFILLHQYIYSFNSWKLNPTISRSIGNAWNWFSYFLLCRGRIQWNQMFIKMWAFLELASKNSWYYHLRKCTALWLLTFCRCQWIIKVIQVQIFMRGKYFLH